MKKLILPAVCLAALSAAALPTYEPFTEYSSLLTANPTNAIDLATGGYAVTTGSVTEQWGGGNSGFGIFFAGVPGLASPGTNGYDIVVTNNPASVFTGAALQTLLPTGFPGLPGANDTLQITAYAPQQPANNNTVGNSAVLQFSQDITRPATGAKTLYVSYLLNVTAAGQTGGGNNGRFAGFLQSTNLAEGPGTSGYYQTWSSLFNTFGASPKYISYGFKTGSPALSAGSGDDILPDDSSGANTPASGLANIGAVYNTPNFIVGGVTLTPGGSIRDTNTVWVNPPVSSFGGAAPPTENSLSFTLGTQVSDLDAFVIIDRVGHGALGGTGPLYIGNLLIGTTWSYVTGGPEFTNQPANTLTNLGSTVSLTGAAVAAAQTVSYQWQKIVDGATNNIVDGPGGAGGTAVVNGATGSTLTLAGISSEDTGSYQLVATAGGTGFTLASSVATVTSDPLISQQPQSENVFLGNSATFTIAASTQFGSLTYQWLLNGSPLTDGALADGSTIQGANTATLTIGNFQADESGDTVSVAVSNSIPDGEISSAAVLTVLPDPSVISQPQSLVVNYGGQAVFSAEAQTAPANAPLSFTWLDGSTPLANGAQTDGSVVSGAQGVGSGALLNTQLTLTNVSYHDNGSYTLVITNAANQTSASVPVTLTVNDPFVAAQPPANVEAVAGGSVTIPVAAAGSGVSYQWFNANSGPLSDTGDFSGSKTSSLTISDAQPADAGTYYVVVTGDNGSIQSSNVNVIFDTLVTGVVISPASLKQQTGTHLALVGQIAGGQGGLVHYSWQFDGANLSDGLQSDGTLLSGSATPTLVVSNLHAADAGLYSLVASNVAGVASNAAQLTVTNGLLPFYPSNLVVTRVGDGAQTLSGATGNTLYLDQLTTNASYVSTLQVPDSGASALIVPGPDGVSDGQNESFLTLSSNKAYLNFAGYHASFPYGGADVTAGNGPVRGIAAVDALGYLTLAYTNSGLYNGGNHEIRAAYSTDGLTNFWTAGAAGSAAIKYVQAGPGGAAYATGNNIPGLSTATTGPRVLGLLGPNLVFSDFADSSLLGLDAFVGAPELNATTLNFLVTGSPADFAVSPDTNTIYIADDSPAISGGTGYGGGVQRWDWNGGSYAYSYNLEDTTGVNTNGVRGLAVFFPPSVAVWGPGVNGAVVYATTSETVSNRLIEFVDNGAASTPTLLETAAPNQFLQGVRFAPLTLPVALAASSPSLTAYVGQSDTLSVNAAGDGPLSYQWQLNGTNIPGATSATLALTNLQTSGSGTYTVYVWNAVSTNSSSTAVTVTAAAPIVVTPPESRVESAGDHLAFTVVAAGSQPIFYQWQSNGVPIAGATNTYYAFTNIAVADTATYGVSLTNVTGSNFVAATLQVTAGLQPLGSNNLVVSRVGDGLQALSSTTGNTLYLDQYTASGAYSNTIQIPDSTASNALIVAGGSLEAPLGSVLAVSANGSFLNFAGFNSTWPATASLSGSAVFRDIGSVNAYGYYDVPQINQTIYNALDVFNAAVSDDGFSDFWTTGSASAPPGVKFADAATSGGAGGNVALGGSASGTRVIQIINDNVVYSDTGSSPPGIWQFGGEPVSTTPPSVLVSEPFGSSPNDFAFSPDSPAGTVYVADNNSIAAGGGIQRYDWNGSAYALSYTLGTGTGSAVGASGLTVDFSASPTWGPGVQGALLYATTAGTSANQLIKIIDNGPGSAATVLETARANELLRGVRFGPQPGPAYIETQPASLTAALGGSAVFTVAAQDGPFTYQWQFNGIDLTNGPGISGSGAIISGAQTATLTITNIGAIDDGQYTVVVGNPTPNGAATSDPALLGIPVQITNYPAAAETVPAGGTATFTVGATGGAPLSYQWTGPSGVLADGKTPSGSTLSGSATATLTITGVGPADAGSYYVTVNNLDPSSADSSAQPSVLTIGAPPTQPGFTSNAPITLLGASSAQLNFSGTAGTSYRVWGSTNIALTPIDSAWTLLGSGQFSGGADTFQISPTNQQQFFIITQP